MSIECCFPFFWLPQYLNEFLNSSVNYEPICTRDFWSTFLHSHHLLGATTTNLPAGVLYRVKATYRYVREDTDELSFEAGDIINVVEYEDPEDQVRYFYWFHYHKLMTDYFSSHFRRKAGSWDIKMDQKIREFSQQTSLNLSNLFKWNFYITATLQQRILYLSWFSISLKFNKHYLHIFLLKITQKIYR